MKSVHLSVRLFAFAAPMSLLLLASPLTPQSFADEAPQPSKKNATAAKGAAVREAVATGAAPKVSTPKRTAPAASTPVAPSVAAPSAAAPSAAPSAPVALKPAASNDVTPASTSSKTPPSEAINTKRAGSKDGDATREEFRYALDLLRFGQYRRAQRHLKKLRLVIQDPARQRAAAALYDYAEDLNILDPAQTLAFEKQPAAPKSVIGLTTTLSMFTAAALLADASVEASVGVALTALVGAAGFWGGFKLTRAVHIPQAQVEAMYLGAIVTPLTAALLVDGGGFASLLPLASVAGAAGAYFGAGYLKPSPGQVSYISLLAMMGTGSALALANEFAPTDVSNFALGGMWLGIAASAATTKWVDWSQSRVRYVGLGAILGSLFGAAAQALIDLDNPDNIVRATALGSWLGFTVGIVLTDSMPASPYVIDAGPTAAVAPTTLMDSRGGAAPGLAFSGSF